MKAEQEVPCLIGTILGKERILLVVVIRKSGLVFERFQQSHTRIIHARDRNQHAEHDYDHIDGHLMPLERFPLQMQVKVAWPYEREHGARDAADEAHQYSKMRYKYGEKEREQNEAHTQTHRPELQITVHVIASTQKHGLRIGQRVFPRFGLEIVCG